MTYSTPQYKIKRGNKIIAQAYDPHTAAYIALSFEAEISYAHRCIVWRGKEEEMIILGLDANTVDRVGNVIYRRVKEYWAQSSARSKQKWDDLQTEIQNQNLVISEANK